MIQLVGQFPCQFESAEETVQGPFFDDMILGIDDPQYQFFLGLLQPLNQLMVACLDFLFVFGYDENGLYFLTAKGKNFYDRLKANENIAFTAMRGDNTLSCVAVSVHGKAREIGPDKMPELFRKNPYMEKIYPDPRSRSALTVFKIYEGTGEWFDLSQLPIERASFSFGGAPAKETGYFVTDKCIGCKLCYGDQAYPEKRTYGRDRQPGRLYERHRPQLLL